MGQKYAAYDTTGRITGLYDSEDSPPPAGATTLPLTTTQWQNVISTPGYTVANGALFAPAPPTTAQLLAAAKANQLAQLSAACATAITAGFTSAALGTACGYGSQLQDQSNLQAAMAAGAGGPLWCSRAGIWSFAQHTPAQTTQVLTDWISYRTGLQTHYASLAAQVNTATTVSAVQAVVW